MKTLTLAALCAVALTGCATTPRAADPTTPRPYVELANAPWTRDAIIYQINTRQFTREGTFAAAQRELPRLKALGVDIENHDSNAWEGTMRENFGPALEAMTALSFTGEGIPMIHNGQEACNAKRLEFFEKDPIDWSQARNCAYGDLLQRLIAFRKANPALANGRWGARMHKVETDRPQQLFAWVRRQDGNKVLGLFNFSAKPVTATLKDALPAGDYVEFAGNRRVTLAAGDRVTLPAWGFRLLASGSRD